MMMTMTTSVMDQNVFEAVLKYQCSRPTVMKKYSLSVSANNNR